MIWSRSDKFCRKKESKRLEVQAAPPVGIVWYVHSLGILSAVCFIQTYTYTHIQATFEIGKLTSKVSFEEESKKKNNIDSDSNDDAIYFCVLA